MSSDREPSPWQRWLARQEAEYRQLVAQHVRIARLDGEVLKRIGDRPRDDEPLFVQVPLHPKGQ